MSNILGWFLAIVATTFFLGISAELSMYIDVVTIVFIIPAVYGLSLVIYGYRKTLLSIKSIKYLFISANTPKEQLSNIYSTQIKLTIITSVIGLSAGLMAVLVNYDLVDSRSIGPELAVLMPLILYPSLIIGLIYYPLYKKLA